MLFALLIFPFILFVLGDLYDLDELLLLLMELKLKFKLRLAPV